MSSFIKPTRKTLGAAAALSVGMAALLGTPAFAEQPAPASAAATQTAAETATPKAETPAAASADAAKTATESAPAASAPAKSAADAKKADAASADVAKQGTGSKAAAEHAAIAWPSTPIRIDSASAGSVKVAPTSWKDVESIMMDSKTVPAGWTVSADQATGVITVSWPRGVTEATKFEVPLTIVYADGTSTSGSFVVGTEMAKDTTPPAQAAEIVWESKMLTFTDQPGSQTLHVVNTRDWKNVKSLDLDRTKLPKGGTITGNPITGDVVVTWPGNVPAGTSFTVPVTVTFQDGTSFTSAFTLGNPAKDTAKPTNPTPVPGKSGPTMPTKPTQPSKPAPAAMQAKPISWGARTLVFNGKPGSVVMHVINAQDWKNVASVTIDRTGLPKGWTVNANAATGGITLAWPANVPAGLSFRLPLTVHFADGSKVVTNLRLGNPAKPGTTTPAPASHGGSTTSAGRTPAQAPAMPVSDQGVPGQTAAAPAPAAPAASQPALAHTGAGEETGVLLATGAGAVLLGAGAVFFARRRSA